MSLGTGLGRLADKVFRIGHLGHLNDLTLAGALSGVEMGLGLAGVPYSRGGVQAALDVLSTTLATSKDSHQPIDLVDERARGSDGSVPLSGTDCAKELERTGSHSGTVPTTESRHPGGRSFPSFRTSPTGFVAHSPLQIGGRE